MTNILAETIGVLIIYIYLFVDDVVNRNVFAKRSILVVTGIWCDQYVVGVMAARNFLASRNRCTLYDVVRCTCPFRVSVSSCSGLYFRLTKLEFSVIYFICNEYQYEAKTEARTADMRSSEEHKI